MSKESALVKRRLGWALRRLLLVGAGFVSGKGAHWRMKKHCPLGHEYSKSNTLLTVGEKSTRRRCRTCLRQRTAAAARRQYKIDPAAERESVQRWRRENPVAYAGVCKRSRERARDLLTNSYVAQKLGMSVASVPPALLSLKRSEILLWRATKSYEKKFNEKLSPTRTV